METYQITLNSRTSILIDNQKRSVLQCQLGKDAIPIPKDVQCSVSVITAEIFNGWTQVDAFTYLTIIATTDPNYPTNRGSVGFTTTTTLPLSPGNSFTASLLVSNITGKKFKLNNIDRTYIATASNNLISISAGAGVYLFTEKPIPIIGLYPPFGGYLFGVTLTATSKPFLQQKYLLIGSSFVTKRNQPLAKVPINASYGNYILFQPQAPFQLKINNDLINTFQISLLDEDGEVINNNYNDWSITLQFNFDKKPQLTLDNE